MKKLLLLLPLLFSCTKQDIKITTINNYGEKKLGRVELHIAIFNEQGHNKFGNKSWCIKLQDGYSNADSALLVNQLFWDNEQANYNNIFLGLNNDSYIYDTAWVGVKGNYIIEIPVDIFNLEDTVGVKKKIENWCDNGYAVHTKKMYDSHYDFVKLIYPNI